MDNFKIKEVQMLGKVLYNLGITLVLVGLENTEERVEQNLEWCRDCLCLFGIEHDKNENRYNEINELYNITQEKIASLCGGF